MIKKSVVLLLTLIQVGLLYSEDIGKVRFSITETQKAQADIAYIKVDVEKDGKNLDDVTREVNDIIGQFTSELISKGVKKDNIKTINLNFSNNLDRWYKDNKVSSEMEITILNQVELSAFISTIKSYEKNIHISNISYDVSNKEKVKNELYTALLKEANSKKLFYEKNYGIKLRVFLIDESMMYINQPSARKAKMAFSSYESYENIDLPIKSFTMTVNYEYEIVK